MEKSKLSAIYGLKVTDVLFTDDEAGIGFEDGTSLAIYNRYERIGFVLNEAKRLVGKGVSHVDEGTDTISINFGNEFAIRIDMRGEAYNGPEAMQLRVLGEPIVIWN